MATDLGLVGIVNKGPYNPNETYYQGNFVYNSNNNSTWLLKAVSAIGSEPTENNTDWQLLAKGIISQAFTGATPSANGVMGQVPTPLAGDQNKFLKGSGGWANVPDPQEFTGATSSTDGTAGLLPQPHAGDENKFIRGDGSWASAGADDNFVGTLAQWNALSLAERIKYKTADIIDDFNGAPIDSALSDTSINPIQNRVVKAAIDTLTDVLSPIGQVLFGAGESTSINVPNNTITDTYSITLPAGVWLVIGHANWAANAVGYRQISFGSGTNPGRDQAVTSIPASASNKEHYMQVVRVYQMSSTTTVHLYALQTSGDNLIVYPTLAAIRIK